MKNFFKAISLLLAGLACTTTANAQEGATKDGFMKSAFRDMKESAKLQRQIDKANFRAVRLETKAFYEEQKRLSKQKWQFNCISRSFVPVYAVG